MSPWVTTSVIGGLVLLVSAMLLIVVLVRSQLGERSLTEPLRYALAVNPPREVPSSLNWRWSNAFLSSIRQSLRARATPTALPWI